MDIGQEPQDSQVEQDPHVLFLKNFLRFRNPKHDMELQEPEERQETQEAQEPQEPKALHMENLTHSTSNSQTYFKAPLHVTRLLQ